MKKGNINFKNGSTLLRGDDTWAIPANGDIWAGDFGSPAVTYNPELQASTMFKHKHRDWKSPAPRWKDELIFVGYKSNEDMILEPTPVGESRYFYTSMFKKIPVPELRYRTPKRHIDEIIGTYVEKVE